MGIPWMALAVSVVGAPEESKAQPSGMEDSPLKLALKMLHMATVVVAISRSQAVSGAPGRAIEMGFVPKRGSRPCQGGTRGVALQKAIPMSPPRAIFCAQNAAAPKWLE